MSLLVAAQCVYCHRHSTAKGIMNRKELSKRIELFWGGERGDVFYGGDQHPPQNHNNADNQCHKTINAAIKIWDEEQGQDIAYKSHSEENISEKVSRMIGGP